MTAFGTPAIEARLTTNGMISMLEKPVDFMAMAHQKGWAQVGGSDAHILQQVGSAVTLFKRLPEDETQLAKVIRDGRCSAFQARGMGHSGVYPF